ncbi:hypothetical protein MTP99_006749 [Tenebrio molitor]|nr:hypothetical protein MTP99_006749 [Tenebrio molitor]
MDPDTFDDLLTKLQELHVPRRGHPEISLEKATLLTIWYIGNMESFRGVAARFSVSQKCLSLGQKTFQMIHILWVTWPTNLLRECL